MKKRTQIEKIGVVALAGLCAFLVFRVVSEFTGSHSSSTPAATTASTSYQNSPPSAKNAPKQANSSSDAASSLEMQSLDQYKPRPLPDLGRDPFGFGAPPLTPAQKAAQAARAAGSAMTASAGSARPGIPLRAIGYQDHIGVGPEAYLVDSKDVFIVHDGDVVSRRFKVIRITSMIVEIQDGASGEKAQLPIPIVQ